jgi:hypothetical protein
MSVFGESLTADDMISVDGDDNTICCFGGVSNCVKTSFLSFGIFRRFVISESFDGVLGWDAVVPLQLGFLSSVSTSFCTLLVTLDSNLGGVSTNPIDLFCDGFRSIRRAFLSGVVILNFDGVMVWRSLIAPFSGESMKKIL